MSGLLIFSIAMAVLPFALHMPIVAVLAYEWYQYLSPHDIAWGPLLRQPYSFWFGACAIIGWVIFEKKRASDFSFLLILMILFLVWVNLTTLDAMAAEAVVHRKWDRTVKVLAFAIVVALILHKRIRIEAFILIFVACICFHTGMAAVKTVLGSSGRYLSGSGFVADRNQLAVVMLMSLPLLVWLRTHMTLIPLNAWTRLGLTLAMIAVPLAAVGTQSRGALVAGMVLGLFYFAKARRKGLVLLATAVTGVAVVLLAPPDWFSRMSTVQLYEQDGSAMGRIEAWTFGIEVAVRNPIFGGGFSVFEGVHGRAAHSIFFETLGEQGFIGLGIWLALMIGTYVSLGRLIRRVRGMPDFLWASDLARCIQLSLIAFAAGGAFLSMATYPMSFDLVAVSIAMINLVNRSLAERGVGAVSPQDSWRRRYGTAPVPAPAAAMARMPATAAMRPPPPSATAG